MVLSPLLHVSHLQEFILWGCLEVLESSPEMTRYGDGMMLGLMGLWQRQVHSKTSSRGCRRYGSIMILFYPLAASAQRAYLAGTFLLISQKAALAKVLLCFSSQ